MTSKLASRAEQADVEREGLKAFAKTLTSHEVEVLEMLDGKRPGEWGAWVAACLEALHGYSLCTGGPRYQITDAGRSVLRALSSQTEDSHVGR